MMINKVVCGTCLMMNINKVCDTVWVDTVRMGPSHHREGSGFGGRADRVWYLLVDDHQHGVRHRMDPSFIVVGPCSRP